MVYPELRTSREFDVGHVIVITKESLPATIAAVRHVVRNSWSYDPRCSGHEPAIPRILVHVAN